MSKNLFISYSPSEDQLADKWSDELVKNLSAELRPSIPLWHDREILPGEDWAARITEELESAKVFVVLITPSSLSSEWQNFEMGVALSRAAKRECLGRR